MIPRYRPTLALDARLAALRPSPASQPGLKAALGIEGWADAAAYTSGRAALGAYMDALAARDSRRIVVLSAQICPVVPAVVLKAGLTPWFADTDAAVPAPSNAQLREAWAAAGGAGRVAAVVASPFYGHGPSDPADGLDIGDSRLVLDMAQGLLLAGAMAPMFARADAVVHSFGVGKGLDLGGGLLAERERPIVAAGTPGAWPAGMLRTLPKVVALRAAIAAGAYRLLVPLLDRQVEDGKLDPDGGGAVVSAGPFAAWAAGIDAYRAEVRLARGRAAEIFAVPAVAREASWPEVYGGRAAAHLRQILRMADPSRRDAVVAALRSRGVDALPAGEPLPSAYLPSGSFAGDADWPNARAFRSDAVRLPFLGRTTAAEYSHLLRVLETVLDQRLSR